MMSEEFSYSCPGSAGKICIKRHGDVGGNSQRTTITLTEGQFSCSEIRQVDNGIELDIMGTFEITELTSALVKCSTVHPEELREWTMRE